MAFTPNSRVYLLDTPLTNDYKNQIRFASLDSQYSYFLSHVKHSFDGVTYQRKDNIIRVDKHIDELWDSNYVMYQNTNFGTKWFYAFITKLVYVSDRATDVYIETDVYQTWLYTYTIKESFVVREHVSNDSKGKNLVDEQLEIGEYIMETYSPVNKLGRSWLIMGVSDNSPLGNTDPIGNLYGNVPTGLTYWPFTNDEVGVANLKTTIKAYTDAGKADAIVILFTVPELVISEIVNGGSWHWGLPIPTGTFTGNDYFSENKRLNNLDGYVPKNNKMFNYPYKFLYITNNNGLSATYRYEDFSDPEEMYFFITGSLMPNPKIMLAPTDYRTGDSSPESPSIANFEYGLTLEGFPLASWTTDTYAAWLAQNGASTAIALIGSGVALVGGIATGGLGLVAAGGGAITIAKQLAEVYKASIQPDQAKGHAGSGNLMFGIRQLDYYFAHMSIKAEYAKRIDDFFTMYGYKVNALKIPEIHSRRYWNYIQTIDINIEGAIPKEDLDKIRSLYNNGITLWHTSDGFMDYSLLNTIL